MSYSNLPTAILAGSGITIAPTTGVGSNTITISAAGTSTLTVRNAILSPVVVNGTDEVISVQVPGPVAVAVTLPAGVLGRTYVIKDGLGLAAPATPITITPLAGTIDGALTAVINVPYGSITLVYNGTQWLVI